MKNLKDYEESIYKCSRCGLCQSVCPVFKAALNECAVSRGKFNILNGIIKGDLAMTDKVKSYLDLCTGCNACKDFCPSGIDARKIFISAKHEFYKKNKQSLLQKISNSYFLFKTALLCAGIVGFILRITCITKIIKLYEKNILKIGYWGKRLVLFNSLYCASANKKYYNHIVMQPKRVVYFEGCFNKYINPATENAVKNILASCGIDCIKKNFECCGVSYLHDGNIEAFKSLIKRNLNEVNCEYDYLITDCASCYYVLKEYRNYYSSEEAKKMCSKVISIIDLIKGIEFKAKKGVNIAVHKPCHDNYDFIEIARSIKGINFIDVENYDKCCGFSGKFAIQNQCVSREISRQKIQHYLNKNVDYIITTCPACLLGLNQGLAEIQTEDKPVPINLFVFLDEFCEQINA